MDIITQHHTDLSGLQCISCTLSLSESPPPGGLGSSISASGTSCHITSVTGSRRTGWLGLGDSGLRHQLALLG